MAQRLTKTENFKRLAKAIGVSVALLIEISNLWNSMSDEEKTEIIEQEANL